jgi:thioesterase domain-containing protein
MVHPGLIGAECYAELAHLLDRRIGFRGIDSFNLYNDPMKSSITALAEYYVETLLKNNVEKEVYLGGWSMGGLIAYEMALALEKKSIHVIKLLLIEPDPPNYRNEIIENNQEVDPSKLNNTADYIQDYLKKLPEAVIGKVLSNLSHDLRLCVDYHPSGPHSGEVLIFEAEYWNEDDLIGQQEDLVNAWSPYMAKIKAIKIPGNHLSIMDHPNIKFVAEKMSQEILAGV